MRFHRFAVLLALMLGCAAVTDSVGADPKDDPKATLTRFIAAHNARDLRALGELLSDSPDLLWIMPGHVVRGHDAAIRHFRDLFRHSSRVDLDWSTFETLGLDISTTEIFVRGTITDAAQPRAVRISVVLIDTARGWRVRTFVVDDSPPEDKEKARPDVERAPGREIV